MITYQKPAELYDGLRLGTIVVCVGAANSLANPKRLLRSMPPALYEAMGRQGVHTPTVQLTTHLFARPAPGWIRATFRTRLMANGFLDQDGDLFDEAGTLVATTRQLGLIRTWEH